MSRIQLALNVTDMDQAITFYSRLFDTEPSKRRPGYANFALTDPALKLVLIENPDRAGSLNHLGVEVSDSEAVVAERSRLAAHGLSTEEGSGTCCYASQDKFWVHGSPGDERWEIYTVLADSATFAGDASVCCAGA